MSYTNPHGMAFGKAVDVLGLIREALVGELVAINGYNTHISNSTIPALTKILTHIKEEEQEHYNILIDLLRKYDKEQYMSAKDLEHKINNAPKVETIKKQSDQCILNQIREDLKGEYEAINLYELHFSKIKNKEIKKAFRQIIIDEKHHVEELTDAINTLS